MLDITTFFSENERVTIYQPGICNPAGKYITVLDAKSTARV